MSSFSPSQIDDLRDLQRITDQLKVETVLIGAMAYRLFIDDVNRTTYDIDLAIAVDLNELAQLNVELQKIGWQPSQIEEQRWGTSRRNWIDLLPAGETLRRQGRITWPRSGFVMSLAGFERAFREAVPQTIGSDLIYKVVPPAVFALLKIVSYSDDALRRSKDLIDLRRLMHFYERDSDRLFADEVYDAKLPDVEFAGAFLLGRDLAQLMNPEEASLVESFVTKMLSSLEPATLTQEDWATQDKARLTLQLSAFAQGLKGSV